MPHKFTNSDGAVTQVDRFMAGPKLKPGYWWHDRAPLGSGYGDHHEVVAPAPSGKLLFGYEEKEFMAKQYK